MLHRKLGGNKRAIIFVHNLSYEFQFIYKLFDWLEVFALDNRKVMYARTALFDFRCSYLLSAKSLSGVSKEIKGDYPEYSKKDGDLNYKLVRHGKTELTEKELGYCEMDTLTVNAYLYTQMKLYDNSICKLPFTNTGRVRRLCRKNCFAEKNYVPMIQRLSLTPLEFKMARYAFQGGYVHGNPLYIGVECENIASYDFTSSYPYVMISEKYPMGKGFEYPHKHISEKVFERYCSDHLAIVAVHIENIKVKNGLMPIISSSKCLKLKGCNYDNGKVWSAKELSVVVTNVEYWNIKKFYDIGKITLGQCYFYKAGYLPRPYIETILELYGAKTKLKDYKGKTEEETLEVEREYMLKKNMLNSLYGMMVFNPMKDEFYFDEEWGVNKIEIDEEHTARMNEDKQRFTFYLWGVFVTTYARNNLYSALLECKEDFVYSDTDSVKIFNHQKHKKYFDEYDKTVVEKLLKMCKTYDIDFDECRPMNIKGKRKLLGVWDYEGDYEKFKTLGAKRYMVCKNGEIDMTVSGVNKRKALPYMFKKYKIVEEVIKHFDDNLYLPSEYTGKSIHSYIDDEISGEVTDYKGNTIPFKSPSSVHLIESDYSLSILEDFRNFFRFIQYKPS